MVVKIYISGISGNKEVKKRQQRVLMILDSKNIKYDVIDITEPGKEDVKEFMQNNSKSNGGTVSDPNPRSPLPPQVFNDDEYCGDYDQFDLANEIDTLEQFLKLEVPPEEPPQADIQEEKVLNGDVDKQNEETKSKENSPAKEIDGDKAEETKEGDDGENAPVSKDSGEGDAGEPKEENDTKPKTPSRETSPADKVSSKEPSPEKKEKINEAKQESEKEVSPERQKSVEKEEKSSTEKEKSPEKVVEAASENSKESSPEKNDVSVNENGTVSSREQSEEKESVPESKKENPSEDLIKNEQAAAAE